MGKKFRIIPVVDILNSIAVHANKGQRSTYSPVKSVFIDSSSPKDLVSAYCNKFGLKEIYIADLDSIIDEKPNIELIKEITSNLDVKIMLDAGIRNFYDLLQFEQSGISKLIIATETMNSLSVLQEAIDKYGKERIIVSIDSKGGRLLTQAPKLKNLDLISIIEKVKDFGIKEIILLDLKRVGTKMGCISDICLDIRENFPDLEILIGGGVRNINDLIELRKQGINGALIATALHEGLITAEMLKSFLKEQ